MHANSEINILQHIEEASRITTNLRFMGAVGSDAGTRLVWVDWVMGIYHSIPVDFTNQLISGVEYSDDRSDQNYYADVLKKALEERSGMVKKFSSDKMICLPERDTIH